MIAVIAATVKVALIEPLRLSKMATAQVMLALADQVMPQRRQARLKQHVRRRPHLRRSRRWALWDRWVR